MKRYYYSAAGLLLLATAVRTYDGFVGPLHEARESSLGADATTFFYITWLLVSAFFFVAAIALISSAKSHETKSAIQFGRFIAVVLVIWALIVVVVCTFFAWNPAAVVATTVMLVSGILAFLGSRSGVVGTDA